MPVDIEYLRELHELKKAGALNSFEFQKAKDKAMDNLDDERVGKAKTVFEEADADGDGVVTPEELEAYLAKRAAIDERVDPPAVPAAVKPIKAVPPEDPIEAPMGQAVDVQLPASPTIHVSIQNTNTNTNTNSVTGTDGGTASEMLRCKACDQDLPRTEFSAEALQSADRVGAGKFLTVNKCKACAEQYRLEEEENRRATREKCRRCSKIEDGVSENRNRFCTTCFENHGDGWQARKGYEFKILPNTTCSACDGAGTVVSGDAPFCSNPHKYNPLSVPSILDGGRICGSVYICAPPYTPDTDENNNLGVCLVESVLFFGIFLPSRVTSAAVGATFVAGSLLLLVGTAGCCGMACTEPRKTCSLCHGDKQGRAWVHTSSGRILSAYEAKNGISDGLNKAMEMMDTILAGN